MSNIASFKNVFNYRTIILKIEHNNIIMDQYCSKHSRFNSYITHKKCNKLLHFFIFVLFKKRLPKSIIYVN